MYFFYLIFVTCIYLLTIGQAFRRDYYYNTQINGWLKVHVIPATWQEARQRCHLEGAVLASPLDDELGSEMQCMLNRTLPGRNIYTGVHSMFAKGIFQSIEGVPMDLMELTWMLGQPLSNQSNEQRITYSSEGIAGIVNATALLPYMCFKKHTSDLTLTNCNTIDKEYKFHNLTGNCYKLHNYTKIWEKAFETCAIEDSYLAIPNSEEEALLLKDIATKRKGEKNAVLLGFHDWGERVWRTIHGQTLEEAGYDVWSPGQPDNKGTEFCGSFHSSDGYKLNDLNCDAPLPFICEKEIPEDNLHGPFPSGKTTIM